MTTNQKMFLYAVEEMSFTRAAERAFVTQQCLSNHIRRLEESYGVRLFDRSPKLHLTPAGETLYQALRQIQVIERGVSQELSDRGKEVRGTVTIGIGAARARRLLPALLLSYHRHFPRVRVNVELDETRQLVPRLLDGKIDVFLGIDCPRHPMLQKKFLCEESIYLLATKNLLSRCLPGWDGRRGLSLQELACLPRVSNPAVSTAAQAVSRFLDTNGIEMEEICSVGDYEVQLDLCRAHLAVAFCPEGFLDQVFQSNEGMLEEKQVLVLPVAGLDSKLQIEVVSHTAHYKPGYLDEFQNLLAEEYTRLIDRIRNRTDRLVAN